MKETEHLFNSTIDRYEKFIEEVCNLEKEMTSLSPEEILQRCTKLKTMQEEIAVDDQKITERMTLYGTDIFGTPFIGIYQRILDKADKVCADLSTKATVHKIMLSKELHTLKKNKEGISSYGSKNDISGQIVTKKF